MLSLGNEDKFFAVMTPQRCKIFRVDENYAATGPELTPTDRVIEILAHDILDCYGLQRSYADKKKLFVWIDPKSVVIISEDDFVGERGLLPEEYHDDLKSVQKFPTLKDEYDSN
ncbi:MAG: hypothetical protein ACRC78_01665 [Planktothrix sp.]